MTIVVPMEPWHLVSVSMRMRESDVIELKGCGVDASVVGRQRWACQTALRCMAGIAVLDDSGSPVACFGISDGASSKVGVAFLVAVDGFDRHLRTGVRAWRRLLQVGPWVRIEATVFAELLCNAKFLSWLGFAMIERLKGVREDGGDLLAYSMEVAR